MDAKSSKIEKFGTVFGCVLAAFGLIAYGRHFTDWLRHRTPPKSIAMHGVVVDIDHNANTFVIIENGELHEYNVEGKMPLGEGVSVVISYRPAFHWYRLTWQDKNEIDIEQVDQLISFSPKQIDNSEDKLDDQILKALQPHAPRKDDQVHVGDTVEVP